LGLLQNSRNRARGMTQEVDYLPSKHKALSSNSSTVKKKNQKQNPETCPTNLSIPDSFARFYLLWNYTMFEISIKIKF
jgi:hypothetical protein